MTNPALITEPHYKDIWEKLNKITYPCTIVVYGHEKDYITSHNRSTYPSSFSLDFVQNAEEAWNLVDCGWQGYPPDLKVYACYGDHTDEINWRTC